MDAVPGMVRENVIAQQANLRTHPSAALAESPTTAAVTSQNLRQVWRRWPGAFGHRSLPGYALRAQCPPLEVILRGAG